MVKFFFLICCFCYSQIQFFDVEGNLIPYDSKHVGISGHVGEGGDLGNLANGKKKVYSRLHGNQTNSKGK